MVEFYEKLRELRKSRGLTQEELAEALFVSRTAISKWELGKGYPGIDSLKEISNFFSVSIDDLLSGEKLISIAENENKRNIRNMCELLFGVADIISVALIFLPLYPKPAGEHIFSVNLLEYTAATPFNRTVYWILFVLLSALGISKTLLVHFGAAKQQRLITAVSMALSALTVLFLAMAREAYAVAVAFVLLIIKGLLILKCVKAGD